MPVNISNLVMNDNIFLTRKLINYIFTHTTKHNIIYKTIVRFITELNSNTLIVYLLKCKI